MAQVKDDGDSISRSDLSKFLPNHRLIVAFENLQDAVDLMPDQVAVLTAGIAAVQAAVVQALELAGSARSNADMVAKAVNRLADQLMSIRPAYSTSQLEKRVGELETFTYGSRP